MDPERENYDDGGKPDWGDAPVSTTASVFITLGILAAIAVAVIYLYLLFVQAC